MMTFDAAAGNSRSGSVRSGRGVSAPTPPPASRNPQAFVDAGDVLWADLEPVLRRELAALQPDEVLELKSGDAATVVTLPGWCAGEGYVLIHIEPDDRIVSFWIRRP
jgi:TusA-related sulfurtransferase